MRKYQIVALVALGGFVLFLAPALSRTITHFAESTAPVVTRQIEPPKPPHSFEPVKFPKPNEFPIPQPQPESQPKEKQNPGHMPFFPKKHGGKKPPPPKHDDGEDPLKGLGPLLKSMDKNGDGKISAAEWRGELTDFRELDRNGDGFITPDEFLRDPNRGESSSNEVKLTNNRGKLIAEVTEQADSHHGKRAYKILKVKLLAGKTYQIDLTSRAFQAFIYLEDAHGAILKEHSSPTIGGNSRVVYRVEKTAVYRIVATSLGGFRVGPFLCAVKASNPALSALPRGVAVLFEELDKDGDGQIGRYEWKGTAADFRLYDRNGDGFITPEEMLHVIKQKE